MKICSKCGIEKPLDEFSKHKITKDGLKHECKSCKKDYYHKRRPIGKIKKREYYVKNRGSILKDKQKYRGENKDYINAWAEKYRNDNKELLIERRKSFGSKLKILYNSMIRRSISRRHPMPNFSFEEWTVWAFENGYKELYGDWKNDNYNKWLAPSPNRLKNDKPYTFDNMELVTWKENLDKV